MHVIKLHDGATLSMINYSTMNTVNCCVHESVIYNVSWQGFINQQMIFSKLSVSLQAFNAL